MVTPITASPPTLGQQPWFDTREAFDQAVKTKVNELASSVTGLPNMLLLAEGDDIPVGTPSGTLIIRIPNEAVPLTTLETTTGSISSEAALVVNIPTDRAVGDSIIAAVYSNGSHSNFTWPAGWVEIDYSSNQSAKVSFGIYSIVDSTALEALDETISVNSGSTTVVAAVAVAWTARDSAPAPSYASGTNRSAATVSSQTSTGGTFASIATVTASPIKDVYVVVGNKATLANPVNGMELASSTLVGHVDIVDGSVSLNLTVRKLTTPPSAQPIPAQIFTLTHANSDAIYGGGVFVVAGT